MAYQKALKREHYWKRMMVVHVVAVTAARTVSPKAVQKDCEAVARSARNKVGS